MRARRFTRALVAALMAMGLVSAVGLSPATATVRPNVDPATVVAVIKQIYSLYQQFIGGGSGGLTLEQAVAQIEAQIQASQTAIIDEIDQVAAANVRACAESAVINFADLDAFTPDTLQTFALNATDCVTQANALLGALTDKAAVDQVGFAMNTVGPLALMARTKAGLTTPALKAVLVAGENTLISALLPACTKQNVGDPGHPFYDWDCIAYNGTEAEGKPLAAAQNLATANTSRAIAQAALPTLS